MDQKTIDNEDDFTVKPAVVVEEGDMVTAVEQERGEKRSKGRVRRAVVGIGSLGILAVSLAVCVWLVGGWLGGLLGVLFGVFVFVGLVGGFGCCGVVWGWGWVWRVAVSTGERRARDVLKIAKCGHCTNAET